MEKTRLGISVGLLAAIMYFMGILNLLGLLLIAGYILFCEKDLWLRKSAVKAVLIYAVFAVITLILGVIDNCFGILNTMIGWLFSFRIDFPSGFGQYRGVCGVHPAHGAVPGAGGHGVETKYNSYRSFRQLH